MKRAASALSLVFALALMIGPLAIAQTHKTAKIGKQQLLSLISTAETPAQHRRIARYYEAEAQDFLAQSREHDEQGAAYKKNPMTSSSKFKTDTVDHCDYFVKSFKDAAAKDQELAQMHEEMAKDAEKK